jgi:hypothetical protein
MQTDQAHCHCRVPLMGRKQLLPIRIQKAKCLVEGTIRLLHAVQDIQGVELIVVLHWSSLHRLRESLYFLK